MSWICTEQKFLERVAKHELKVVRNDGVYRHLRFSKPGTCCDSFDVVTWPGHLCYTGDMGTYVFSRVHDMFQFFRCFPWKPGETIGINEDYWAEKTLAVDRPDGITEFDRERFKAAVLDDVRVWMRDGITKAECLELYEAVKDEILSKDEEDERVVMDAVYSFSCEVGGNTYRFEDFWENKLTRYTGRFVFCCYAVAWGIRQFEAREEVAGDGEEA